MGSSSSQQSVIEQKQSDRNEQIRQLQEIVAETKESLGGNKSLPNLFRNFSKLLQKLKPELRHFKVIVDLMKKNWIQISKCLNKLEPIVGVNEIEDMRNIQKDYWLLLLNTKAVMEIIVVECEIQQSNVETVLDIINDSIKSNGYVSNDDKIAHRECIQSLGEWIDVEELNELFNDWSDMCDKLSKKKISWAQRVKAYAFKDASKDVGRDILKWVGILLGVSAATCLVLFSIVAISFATAGAGAAPSAAAGAVAVKTITVGGFAILQTHALGIVLSVGTLALAFKCHSDLKQNDARYQAYNNAKQMLTYIQDLLKNSKQISKDVHDNITATKNMEKRKLKYLKKESLRREMEKSLKEISEYLTEYISQCKDVIKAVNKACKTYINL